MSKEDENTVHGTTTATTSTCNSVNLNAKVLLQTATALASNQDRTKTTKARILFDNGRHWSYVTHHLLSRLNLKSHKTKPLHLNTFGQQNYRKERCEVVKIRISKPGCSNKVQISTLSFPVICSAIPKKGGHWQVSTYPALGIAWQYLQCEWRLNWYSHRFRLLLQHCARENNSKRLRVRSYCCTQQIRMDLIWSYRRIN